MRLLVEIPHSKYRSSMFNKSDLDIILIGITNKNNIEMMTIDVEQCTMVSIYKVPCIPFTFKKPENYRKRNMRI